MAQRKVYDIAGIGIGPFNLGLAALCKPIRQLSTIFIDQKKSFEWHSGMMIAGTTLQVSFLADLVTLVDPSSNYSYLNYLRKNNRLLQFGIHEKIFITRQEYNLYCRWVCQQLENLKFGYCVKNIHYRSDKKHFEIRVQKDSRDAMEIILARRIVIGVGAKPYTPVSLSAGLGTGVIHSSKYLAYKNELLKSKRVTVIGSGQSAAEIFYDLLNSRDLTNAELNWFTRSDRFYAMEQTKLNYEMTSPEYINFFYKLAPEKKSELLQGQFSLYKGINGSLIDAIYDKLYQLSIGDRKFRIQIRSHAELKRILRKPDNTYQLLFYHNALGKRFSRHSDFVVLATGYQYQRPPFLQALHKMVGFDEKERYKVRRNYSIDDDNRVFVQNAEMHTHGFNTPDLGLGAYRNAVILNTILEQHIYPMDEHACFQSFDVD